MRKACFLFIFGMFFLLPCFSQNMLLAGGEYNFFKPEFWSAGAGFNMKLFNDYMQNDFMINGGRIRAKEPETGDYHQKFLFSLRDSLYFSLEGEWVGLRMGVFASFGVYDIVDFPKVYDLFLNGGGFAGVSILPKSMISVTVDICPGYASAFRYDEKAAKNEAGFSLSVFLSLRLNIDKL